MKQITAVQFQNEVERNPGWAAGLTEPVEVVDHCALTGSNITHLSPLLHFTGISDTGGSAYFNECDHLLVAEGHFAGCASFADSGIREIGEIHITAANNHGVAASFFRCKNLKTATGTFPGSVNFSGSGVDKIQNLKIETANISGNAASFANCKNLKVAEGTFPGKVTFATAAVTCIGELEITPNKDGQAADFAGCTELTHIPTKYLTDPAYTFDTKTRQCAMRQTTRKTLAAQPNLEI